MIYSLSGELQQIESGLVVVECCGVGYGVRTTTTTIARLGSIGSSVKLFTYMSVREDACELFGFVDTSELRCFKMLTSVSGVGPKAALSILSNITPEKFALCVASSDSKTLTQAQGIGTKIAQRIVLELKDKITNEQLAAGISNGAELSKIAANTTTNATEAISALVVLGYSQSEAASAVATIDASASVEDMIKHGLKKLAATK